jgi:hypothetical protein
MGVLNQTRLTNLEFFEAHVPVWTAAPPPSIGLTAAQTTDLDTKTKACRTSYTALVAARSAAKNATQVFYDKYNIMLNSGRADIGLIKAYAESQTNPAAVYTAAQIPPPAAPGPGPIPTQPDNFIVGLNPDGSIKLTWKAVGDGNTFWMVRRKLAGEGTFSFIGGSGGKSFTDLTIPAGTSSMEYTVFGQRGTVNGPESNVLAVHFGGGDGFSFQTLEAGPAKLAA